MPSNPLTMSINNTQNIPILIGSTASFILSIRNTSTTDRLYNMNLYLTIPNGLVLSSATLTQTSTLTNADNSTTYSWINLKDLAPSEAPYTFTITLKCNTTFKNGSAIPFGYPFSNISMSCQMDTMPRGNNDIGNQQLTAQSLLSFVTVMFNGTITLPGKVLKGAGTSLTTNDYTQISTATCKLYNNASATSLVNITILLADGIRYLGTLSTSGTDASQFLNPTVSTVSINNINYIQLYYSGVTLSLNSATTLTFKFAVWNAYNANQGSLITHGTSLNMSISMASTAYSMTNTSSFAAMDVIINTSMSKTQVDVQNSLTYTYNYAVGGYYDLQDIVVHYYLPDGIYYLSSSFTPVSVVNTSATNGFYITYRFANAIKNSITTGTISAKVNSYYQYLFDSNNNPLPIVSFDTFLATTDLTATTLVLLSTVTDSANVSCSITVPTITKQFIKGYYQNGTQKNINALAPLDLAEYLLTYNASNLNAIQKQVYIDDFFPLAADPITNLNYTYTGNTPLTPAQLISPHGVDFYYGDLPGHTNCTINFKVPISQLGSASQNINLMKLKGLNTPGYAYSNRTQVTINIGSPNLQLTKSVAGPHPSAIQASEVYTYTVKISNTSNLGTETDAFNFTLTDPLSTWFTLNPNSINISGSGIYSGYTVSSASIILSITSLAPGQSLTLTYSVTISPTIAPGVTITTAATTTNPYAQLYNDTSPNYQYTNLVKTASATLSSAAIGLNKSTNTDLFRVGSTIIYTLTLTIPIGTIAYGVYVKDVLSSGNQTYLGPSYRNGTVITPTISSNTVTFPSEGTLDARNVTQTITYIFYAKITNGSKSINALTSTQTNNYQCIYQQTSGGSNLTISKNLSVTINHPNILLGLSGSNLETLTSSNQTLNASLSNHLQFTLAFQNNSNIPLLNGTVQIPINANLIFSSIVTTTDCTAYYNTSTSKIIITIPRLNAGVSGFISFNLLPQTTLHAGSSINLQATATSYYNDLSTTKVYSGETSNTVAVLLPPGVSLLPNPLTQINATTSFIVTAPGDTATIINYFQNTGGGYDDFTLRIASVALAYSLWINNQKVADVAAYTPYQAALPAMSNLAPLTALTITLLAPVPSTCPRGQRYDFLVTATSNTSPNPSQTVLNIDPY